MRRLSRVLLLLSALAMACGAGQTAQNTPATDEPPPGGDPGSPDPTAPPPSEPVIIGGEATRTGADPAQSKLTEQDKLDINGTIKLHREELTACFDQALATRTLPLDGFLVKARFTIETDGRVSGAQVTEATERFQDAEQCFLIELATIPFAPPPDGRVVEAVYPFTIKRKSH